MKIIINGVEREIEETSLDYHEIVQLAFGKPMMRLQTITHFARLGPSTTRMGSVYPHGPRVELIEGMSINCSFTGNA